MWENAYLSIKNPKASRALKQALDPSRKIARFARATALHYIGNFRPQNLGPPLEQILDPHLDYLLASLPLFYRRSHNPPGISIWLLSSGDCQAPAHLLASCSFSELRFTEQIKPRPTDYIIPWLCLQ